MREGLSGREQRLGKGLLLAALCLLAISGPLSAGGCQSKETQPAATKSAEQETDPASLASAAPAIDAALAEMHPPRFKVDGKKLKGIAVNDDFELLSIASLPPIEDWKILIIHSIEGREFRVTKPAQLTGQRTMKIVKQPDESYEFLVMQLEGHGQSVRHRMPRIKVVEIQTHTYVAPAPQKEKAKLAITMQGEKRELGPSQLDAIARTPEPASEKERDTWLLLDLLGKKTTGAQESVVLRAAEGKTMTLTSEMLQDKTRLHLIKRNRRAQFHYREWRLTEPPTQEIELRDLVGIELL